ncbi:MAG: hypothetical protein FJY99_10780 [Candidatus Sericytochromatia bacterium]|nr:hypothetical protein [Candidatus Tanganyikabacteria bacterium]
MDNGTAQSRYAALFATVHNIAQTSVTPAQPAGTQRALGEVVSRARQAIGGLEGAVSDPATTGVEARAADKVRAIRQDAAAIPTWQKVLLVGLIRKGTLNGRIKDIERDLATLKAANPSARLDVLATLAARAWEASQQGAEATTLDQAERFARDADPIRRETDQVRRRSDDQTEVISKRLKTLGSWQARTVGASPSCPDVGSPTAVRPDFAVATAGRAGRTRRRRWRCNAQGKDIQALRPRASRALPDPPNIRQHGYGCPAAGS